MYFEFAVRLLTVYFHFTQISLLFDPKYGYAFQCLLNKIHNVGVIYTFSPQQLFLYIYKHPEPLTHK